MYISNQVAFNQLNDRTLEVFQLVFIINVYNSHNFFFVNFPIASQMVRRSIHIVDLIH